MLNTSAGNIGSRNMEFGDRLLRNLKKVVYLGQHMFVQV